MAAAGMRLVPPASPHSSVLDLSSMMAPPFGLLTQLKYGKVTY